MAAIVTDQFRILNANNFIESVTNDSNSYYVCVGLPNPTAVGFGRTADWNTNTPSPIDSFNNLNHVRSTLLFGKKITSANVRRVIKRVDWVRGSKYEAYRHDYSVLYPSPITQSARLYDANYYVMNSDYKVYICIDNGSSGITTGGNASQDEPTFTDLEPSAAGESGDGYLWKYLFSVAPSDIIKFDSTEYITVPNNWESSTDPQISLVRDNGDSSINLNQIKKVYLEKPGFGYAGGPGQKFNIYGDGTGASVVLDVDTLGQIGNVRVSSGGKDYTYGVVDLSSINGSATKSAKLVPIIPPSKGHGFDIYQELGTDKVLVYARFDDSTKDFPVDTKFSQVSIIKNPVSFGSTSLFKNNDFSATYALKLVKSSVSGSLNVGDVIKQTIFSGGAIAIGTAFGYVTSYDVETNVVKYIQDRSLYFNPSSYDQTDWKEISRNSDVLSFEPTTNSVTSLSGFSGTIDTGYTGITTTLSTGKIVNLSAQFNNGLANPEINKTSGDVIYLDNRPLISRNQRQKEDIKIILEF